MSQENNFQGPKPQKTVLDTGKMKLSSRPMKDARRPPTFEFNVYRNNVRARVYFNDDRTNTTTLKMENDDLFMLLDFLDALCDGTAIEKFGTDALRIDVKNEWKDNKKLDSLQVVGAVMAGHDDGEIYVAAVEKEKPPIKFTFSYNKFSVPINNVTKEPMDKVKLSERRCAARVHLWRDHITNILRENYDATPMNQRRDEAKKEYGGGKPKYNNNSSDGPRDDFDDLDI
jgi:hypothetical protein